MNTDIIVTETQKAIIRKLADSIHTVEYIEEWINKKDNINVNPFSALMAMSAKGFYQAVLCMEKQGVKNYGE